jgi:hypothetical protein
MTDEWEYYDDLRKKYQYSREKILDLLRDGLQPYDGNGKKIYCKWDFHEYFHWRDFLETHPGFTGYGNLKKHRFVISVDVLKRIEERENAEARIGEISNEESNLHEYGGHHPDQFNKLSWNFVWKPEDTTKKEELFSILRDTKYKTNEVDELLDKNHPLYPEEFSVKSSKIETKSPDIENQDNRSLEEKISVTVIQAKPQIDKIWKIIFRVYNKRSTGSEREELMQTFALVAFEKNPENYKSLKREYLLSLDIYVVNDSNMKRDFTENLLQTIVQDKHGEKYNKRNLLKMSQEKGKQKKI